ncbi:MAG: hypothetical protein KA604_01560 [Candidatus Saccharimonas sp.]|nr:hypothetical protein [Candidatus Saccharimonas sp.]
MQPNQQQVPEEWQQPQESGPQPPFQSSQDDELTDEITTETTGGTINDTEMADDEVGQDIGEGSLVRWQGTEYIHRDQTALWYVILAVITIILVVVAYVAMRSITFAVLIPVMAATLVLYTKRPPSINDYALSRKGLYINDKLYPYAQFKSFSVISHNNTHSIVLVPRKRFQIGQTIYFPEETGEQLVDMLAARLPMKEGSADFIDRILARLKL